MTAYARGSLTTAVVSAARAARGARPLRHLAGQLWRPSRACRPVSTALASRTTPASPSRSRADRLLRRRRFTASLVRSAAISAPASACALATALRSRPPHAPPAAGASEVPTHVPPWRKPIPSHPRRVAPEAVLQECFASSVCGLLCGGGHPLTASRTHGVIAIVGHRPHVEMGKRSRRAARYATYSSTVVDSTCVPI